MVDWLLRCLRLQMSPKSVSPKDNKSKAAFGRRESTRPSKYAHFLTFPTSKGLMTITCFVNVRIINLHESLYHCSLFVSECRPDAQIRQGARKGRAQNLLHRLDMQLRWSMEFRTEGPRTTWRNKSAYKKCTHPGHAKLNMPTANSLCSIPRGANQESENTILFYIKSHWSRYIIENQIKIIATHNRIVTVVSCTRRAWRLQKQVNLLKREESTIIVVAIRWSLDNGHCPLFQEYRRTQAGNSVVFNRLLKLNIVK